MTQTLVSRLEQAMQEKGFNSKSLSLEAGLNETAVRDILTGRSKNPRTDTSRKIAQALGVRHEWLVDGFGAMAYSEEENSTLYRMSDKTDGLLSQNNQYGSTFPFSTTDRIPLLGQTHDNQMEWDYHIDQDRVIEWGQAHPFQQGIDKSFALYVVNNRMAPRFYTGDILYCHPHQPVRTGQDCLIVSKSGASIVGVLKHHYEMGLSLSFYNQDNVRVFHKDDIRQIIRLVGASYQ